MRVLQVGHVEGWMAGVQDKKDDSKGKQIDDLTLIGLLSVDLRSHEAQRPNNTPVHTIACSALNGAREAEIDDFDIIELVK